MIDDRAQCVAPRTFQKVQLQLRFPSAINGREQMNLRLFLRIFHDMEHVLCGKPAFRPTAMRLVKRASQ
jgi:hypothetical protein